MHFFKGYILTKEKKSIEPLKNRTEFKTISQVSDSPEYAGVLADDVVLIDIDDEKSSDIMFQIVKDFEIKCRVYQTTRGKHFLFKNNNRITKNKTNTNLAIGLRADIKIGANTSYEVLKINGVEREILLDFPEIDLVPKIFFPVKSDIDFTNLGDGDGRNNSLYGYICTLQLFNYEQNEIKQVENIINQYVLKEPLCQEELDVILRKEAFPVKNEQFEVFKFAQQLQQKFKIIKINNRLHIYNQGVYEFNYRLIERSMIELLPSITERRRKEVLSYLNVIIENSNVSFNDNLIAFKNGIYNIRTGELSPMSPEHIITNLIPWNLNTEATCELVDDVLLKLACGDERLVELLEECVGYCFYRRNELGKAFILTGNGANGKSTYIDMIKTMLGDDNIASLDLGELGQRFKTAELFGKLANLGDDIGDRYIDDSSIFKKLVTGDRVSVEKKGQDPFEFNNYCKFLFSANSIPRMKDTSGALMRRLIIIPFDAKFSKKDPDYNPYIKHRLRQQDSMERLIVLGLRGLSRIITREEFTTTKKVEEAKKEYEVENDPIVCFVEDVGLDNIIDHTTSDIYLRYRAYCDDSGIKSAFTRVSFVKMLNKKYELTTKQKRNEEGEQPRCFIKI